MRGTLFKGPGTGVTMQALAIIEGSVELDVFRLRDFPQVLNIDVMQSPPFGCNSAKHRVIGVAGITSMIPGNAVVENAPPVYSCDHLRKDSCRNPP